MPGPLDMNFTVSDTKALKPFTRELVGFIPGGLLLSPETQHIRFWYGGTTPTADSGHLIYAGGSARFTKTNEIENLQIIAVTGTAEIFATVSGI